MSAGSVTVPRVSEAGPTSERAHPSGERRGMWRIGQIAGVDVLISPTWLFMAVLIAVLIAPRIEQVQPGLGAGKYVAGVAFAVLLYSSILLHEGSHAVMAKRFGLPVSSITLHFLGGMTQVDRESPTPGKEFMIAVVGPLTSLAVGVTALAAAIFLPLDGLILLAVEGLAGTNIIVGLLNLVPGLPLDGGRLLRAAVWKVQGNPHRASVVAGWAGRLAAALVVFLPAILDLGFGIEPDFTDYLISFLIAMFLWQGATASIVYGRMRLRLPRLRARDLARRTLTVPESLPVAEAVRRAREAGAGSLVSERSDGTPAGIVNETALLATPEDRRPWLPVSAVARTLEPGLRLPADIDGEDLLRAMQATPSAEYLLVEPDGSIFGVLVTADVDTAFSGR